MTKHPKQQQWMWVPKKATQQQQRQKQVNPALKNTKKNNNRYKKHPMNTTKQSWNSQPTQRWIPPKMLQEQGYYKGFTQIWLPKKAKDIQPLTQKAKVFKPKAQPKKASPKTTKGSQKTSNMEWRVKNAKPKMDVSVEIKKKIMSPPVQAKSRLTREQKGKWVPKAPIVLATTKEEAEVICSSSWIQWMRQ